MAEIASLRGISKSYPGGIMALQDLTCGLEKGECLAFLGPNGAGKTTTIKVLCGLLKPEKGEVSVKGEVFFPGSQLQRVFGVALAEIGLWPYLSVEESVRFAGRLYGLSSSEISKRTGEIFREIDLEEWRSRRVDSLSDGLKRRVNLACALVHQPEILILDEPSSGLDPRARERFWEYLERMIAREQMTLFLSTHDMEEADRLGTRVGILHKGKLVALDSADRLKEKYGKGDEIGFDSSPSFSPEILSDFPGMVKIERNDGRISISILKGIERLPEIFARLEQKGIKAENLRVSPNTLGSVFLSLTGAALEEKD